MHNECIFVGRLGKDPDVRTTENGRTVAQFSIACDEPGYTTKDGKEVQKRTEWIPIVVWDKAAENAGKYLHKGSLVMVVGKFRTRSYEKDGITIYRTDIYADNVKYLDPKKDGAPLPPEPDAAGGNQPSSDGQGGDGKDDLPF